MAYSSAPLPGVSQLVSVSDWEAFFAAMSLDCVVAGELNQLNPSLDTSGRNAVIDTGKALLRGFEFSNTSSTATAVPAASSQSRIDRLVLRLNRAASTAATFIVPTVITGTPAAQPAEPALTRTTGGLWDLPVFRWTSASSGGLTGLADERGLGADVLSGLSSARPAMAGPGLLLETDTGNLARWDGSAWSYIIPGPDTWRTAVLRNGWKPYGTVSLRYRMNRDNCVLLSGELAPGTTDNGTNIATVDAAYAPNANNQFVAAWCDNAGATGCAVRAGSDGTISIQGVPPAATHFAVNGFYPLD